VFDVVIMFGLLSSTALNMILVPLRTVRPSDRISSLKLNAESLSV